MEVSKPPVVNSLHTLDTMAHVAMPCAVQGCCYTTAELDPFWTSLHYQQKHTAPVRQVEDSEEKVAEDTPNKEVDPKPVDTTQPILQEVDTQQVPGMQQPEYRHEQVVVEDHAASQDQVVLLSMDGDHVHICHFRSYAYFA